MGSMGHMKPDDFRRIKQDFRAKSTQYKRMKAELNELRAEKGVLQRTVAILESRCHDLDGFVQEQVGYTPLPARTFPIASVPSLRTTPLISTRR